ncbi:LOW QUALITY PROTEIN: hypothetical protein TorRG33x02_271480 [Trema orientale]|uniref:Uncharacterized protein n=1 Tax=Trema orientale TaxID=63057 RepID=A0A2P5CVM5_TREOI|nr:LOW QUALITY PROTEIN: hypothetical protein TorRG33x02_271480 [Trema orientale]
MMSFAWSSSLLEPPVSSFCLLEMWPTAKLAAQSASKAVQIRKMRGFLEVRFLRGAARIKTVCNERLKRMIALTFHSFQSLLILFGIGETILRYIYIYI